MSELIHASRALVDGELYADYAFIIENERIIDTGHYTHLRARYAGIAQRSFPVSRLVVPGFINGHSHAYQVLLRGWADDLSFASWRSDALYRVVPQLTPDDIYTVFVYAFSEMLAAGITTVVEFFYLNGAGNEHAVAAIAAAQATGIRLVLARTWMDAPYAPPAFRETIEQAFERTDDLRRRFPDANVCVAPHSLHAASPEMIRAAADFARKHGCKMHIHVAEAAYEGEQTLKAHGATPVNLLDQLDALDDRTVAVHAIFITQQEKELLAERKACVIHNPVTNMYLGDGICDVVGMQALGITMGLGTDADVKPSIIDEIRAASYLQKIEKRDGAALGARTAFDLGTSQGARAIGIDGGALAVGNFADFVVLDATGIDSWNRPLNGLVYRAESSWVQATFVGGRRVYIGEARELEVRAREAIAVIAKRLIP